MLCKSSLGSCVQQKLKEKKDEGALRMLFKSPVEKWMHPEILMLADINQTHRLTYHMVSLTQETQHINKEQDKRWVTESRVMYLPQMERGPRDRGRERGEKRNYNVWCTCTNATQEM